LNQNDSCTCSNTVEWATSSLSAIESAGSKRDLSEIAAILPSRSSRGGLPLRISSCRFWWPRRISVI
jgi:hypothetical protein